MKESLVNKNSLIQLKRVSDMMGGANIGDRVSDNSFANALKDTKKDITKYKIDTYEDFIKEPFEINQNRKPWEQRKNK